jgi:hypothetical protein
MEPLIVVLTCERPKSGWFLENTVRAIDREGGRDLARMIVVDGDQTTYEKISARLVASGAGAGWQMVPLGQRTGSTLAMNHALVRAAQEARDVLFFEDDVYLCRNAVRRMRQVTVPDRCGCLTFFDMKEVPRDSPAGLYRRMPRQIRDWSFWGCQALKLPADMVRWLADRNWGACRVGGTRMASDTVLGRLIVEHPDRNEVAVHIPCLVQHVGHLSACFPGLPLTAKRTASNFAGAEFDATSLPGFDRMIESLPGNQAHPGEALRGKAERVA